MVLFPSTLGMRMECRVVVRGESGAPATDLSPCLWLAGLGADAHKEGRAW